MKIKGLLSILLIMTLLAGLFTACGNKESEETPDTVASTNDTTLEEKEPSINPALISAFGEEMIESEKETINEIVTGLEECYEKHQKEKDVYTLLENVEDFMTPYKDYLKEISSELQTMYQNAENDDEMMELLTTYNSSIAYISKENTWSMYKFMLDNNMEPSSTEQEAEEAVFEYMNNISDFFYCQPIVP